MDWYSIAGNIIGLTRFSSDENLLFYDYSSSEKMEQLMRLHSCRLGGNIAKSAMGRGLRKYFHILDTPISLPGRRE